MSLSIHSNTIEIVAHRGYAAIFPENTMLAFQRSLQLGAHSIELDVHHSKEGIPVVIHDDKLNRTTTGSGYIREKSLAEIRLADAGVKFNPRFAGCRVPILEEVLDLLAGRFGLQLELKEGINEREAKGLLHLLNIYGMIDHTMIISFYKSNLELIRKLHPGIEVGFLTSDIIALEPVAALGRASVCLDYHIPLKYPKIIKEAEELGIDVTVWTIRQAHTAKKLYDLGIRRFTSDIPLRPDLTAL
ncbi:glycerophosphodiester phosphodiesterase family protein [Paenibacillus sp. 1001270B_150601_E10]|uniref:glycerophosphodiester phosphodiesterase family protein n=1 Tax=Paenibacillus sp. 1001270B_150601_E10 TaxID=2787079 RepID=UPI00189CC28A|nr:glycerophosphodiester phosphodiesterase family protein [Paenibacillus sp. 1001270B_150601_E10]